MADGQITRQTGNRVWRKDIRHVPHVLVAVDLAAVARCDAGAFLPTMLKRVQPQVGEIRRFRMAVNGEDATFFVKFVEHQVCTSGIEGKTPERSPNGRASDAIGRSISELCSISNDQLALNRITDLVTLQLRIFAAIACHPIRVRSRDQNPRRSLAE